MPLSSSSMEEYSSLLRALDVQDTQLALHYIEDRVGLEGRDEYGNTALHLSVLYGYERITAKLLEISHHLLFEQNIDGETPLHFAVRRNSLVMTRLLLKNEGYNDQENAWHETPLMMARQNSYHDIYQLLMFCSQKGNPER